MSPSLDHGGLRSPAPRYWCGLFAAVCAGWLVFFFVHPEELINVGIGHYRVLIAPERYHELWFMDSFAILASNDAISAGHDPYARNPLDFQERPHIYGPWWLHLRDFGLTRSDNLWLGLALGLAFFLAAMVRLRPHSPRSLLWCLAIFCAMPVLFALERANSDLVIFLVLLPVVPCLGSDRFVVRGLAGVFLAVAAGLKFYPAVGAVVLLTAAPARELRWRLALFAGLVALVGWNIVGNLGRVAAALPEPGGAFALGAANGLHELGWLGTAPQVLVVALGGAIFAACWRLNVLRGWEPAVAQRDEWWHFILGAALLTGCFFAGQSYAYRWIFALWLAPLLWSLPRDGSAPAAVRRLARTTGGLLLVALWLAPLCMVTLHWLPEKEMARVLHWACLILQPFTWAFFVCLLIFLAHYVRAGFRSLIEAPPESTVAAGIR